MATLGYRGPALVLEEAAGEMPADVFPAGIEVHLLRKPLQMQQVFRAVADALG
ncbi:hypothetical protein D3C80_2098450 [compost metagenome]